MVSLRNLQKFFNDHPYFRNVAPTMLNRAKSVADQNGIIPGCAVKEILGWLSAWFFTEIQYDPEHVRIGLEDIQKQSPA